MERLRELAERVAPAWESPDGKVDLSIKETRDGRARGPPPASRDASRGAHKHDVTRPDVGFYIVASNMRP